MKKAKGYVSVKLAFHQTKRISELLEIAEVEGIKKSKLHCTVAYDPLVREEIELPECDPEQIYEGKVIGCEPLGGFDKETQTWSAFVLTLDSPQLIEEHNRWMEAGYNHSWPNFIPHLSVAYKVHESKVEQLTALMQTLIGEVFYFNELRPEVLKDD